MGCYKISVTYDELIKCKSLLHQDYQDCKIVVFESKSKFILSYLINFGLDIKSITMYMKGNANALYSPYREEVWIPTFAFKNKDPRFIKQEMVFALFHELRHYYQHKRKPKLFNRRVNFAVDDWRYNTDPIERDANIFASRMCLKYKDEISDIINVYPVWSTIYHA